MEGRRASTPHDDVVHLVVLLSPGEGDERDLVEIHMGVSCRLMGYSMSSTNNVEVEPPDYSAQGCVHVSAFEFVLSMYILHDQRCLYGNAAEIAHEASDWGRFGPNHRLGASRI